MKLSIIKTTVLAWRLKNKSQVKERNQHKKVENQFKIPIQLLKPLWQPKVIFHSLKIMTSDRNNHLKSYLKKDMTKIKLLQQIDLKYKAVRKYHIENWA